MTSNFLAGISRYGQVFILTRVDSTGEGSAWMPSMKKSGKKLMKENGQDFNEENSQFSAQGNVVMW